MSETLRTGWKPVLQDRSTGFQPVLQQFDPDAEVEVRRRNLPHWRQPGATYFVTFRLADSLPQAKLAALRAEREEWLKRNPPPRSAAALVGYQALFSNRVEQYLAAGYGACWLKRPEAADIVARALAHFDGKRYQLGDYVVMPNHVHVLVTPVAGQELWALLHSWKSYTANRINELVGRQGALPQEEFYDHIVRDEDELLAFRAYIAENPIKARLSSNEYRQGP
jgi:REP element-mobilizing transposase RayT